MARCLIERRTIVLLLSLLLLASGTPQALSRQAAQDARIAQALTARQDRAIDEPFQSIGVPPDDDQYRALTVPTASGANPPYPANHTFDAIPPETVGTPPANHGFESPGYAVGLPPANHDLESASQTVGTPPANADFASGDLSGWTTAGTVSYASDATHGGWARLGAGGTLTSSAFTLDPDTQALAIDIGFLSTSTYSQVTLTVLSGASFTTRTQIGNPYCYACHAWQTHAFDLSSWRGQSIKLEFVRVYDDIGIDAPRMQLLFPDYTTSGTLSRITETGGNVAARLGGGGSLISSPFTVDSATQMAALQARDSGAGGQFYLYVLSGATFATETKVYTATNAPDSWTRIAFNASPWQGQSIKLKVVRLAATVDVDELGSQSVDIANWEVAENAWLEPTTIAGASGAVASTDGDLTS